MKVKFSTDYRVSDSIGTFYKKDQIYTLPESSCNHFIARRLAEAVEEPVKKQIVEENRKKL